MVSYLQFYSRKDIQKEILKNAKDREVALKFGDKGFGKRPDILQFEGDVFELAKEGVTSFHISEERWSNPMDLNTGMKRKDLDELRAGWDLILDIDGPFELSRITAQLLVDALKFHDIENVAVKFSGNKGFHLAIPFEAFPEKVHNEQTKDLFPEGPRKIAEYLKHFIYNPKEKQFLLRDKILEKYPEEYGSLDDPFGVVDIDTVLISSRHMFRAPYSIHEKSGLVSVPIDPNKIHEFKKDDAKPENVKVGFPFLDHENFSDASGLIVQAFDRAGKEIIDKEENEAFEKIKKDLSSDAFIYEGGIKKKGEFKIPCPPIKADFFPPCILKIMKGIEEDGRKRALFIMVNFLKSCGWTIDDIKEYLCNDWNQKNYEPLREGYILSQLNWHQRQDKKILPPNCENKAYYKDLRFCLEESFCGKIKNPVNYAIIKSRLFEKQKKVKKKKSSKK
ncbi:MAG: hypothetical protein KKA79_04660 [Nanoarchaeota archaeon]|nr:hypothetical protein [Nanoarchaeota archaeon]MCG2718486.1 hypothetical protein [Nanoarchaeota archaeon]